METTALQTIQNLDVQGAANILTEYQTSLEKAKGVVEGLKQTEYNPDTKPKFDAVIQGLKQRSTELEKKRKPFTSQLNDVVKLFTAVEKGFLELADPLLTKEKAWKQSELEAQRAKEAEQMREATRIRVIAEFVPKVEMMMVDLVHEVKRDLLDRSIAGEDVPPFTFSNETWQGLCKNAMSAIGGTDFQTDLVQSILPKKETMVLEATKSIHEFHSEVRKNTGKTKALQSLGRTLGVSYQEAAQQIADSAESAKVEAEMQIAEAAHVAHPETEIKTKYIPVPSNHKEVLEIFRYWLATENPSVEEAVAQIGKAMTYCKRLALKGTKLTNVTYIEDVK